MTYPVFVQDVTARLDTITDTDAASQQALDALYSATGRIEALVPSALFAAYDAAFVAVYDAVRQSAYLAGYTAATQEAHRVYTN